MTFNGGCPKCGAMACTDDLTVMLGSYIEIHFSCDECEHVFIVRYENGICI